MPPPTSRRATDDRRAATELPAVTTPRTGPLKVSAILWRVLAGLLIVGALVQGTFLTIVLLSHDERAETETFPAGALTGLLVDNDHGRVRIVAADTDEVAVRAEISDGLRHTGESRRVVGDVLELRGTCPNWGSNFCRVDYEVTVPRDLPVTVRARDGRVEVSGLDADLTVNADDDSIHLDDVGGTLDVSTDNGSISGVGIGAAQVVADTDNGSVMLAFDAAPDSVRATSNNGGVDVVVPDDGTAYRAALHTDHGSETLDVPTDPASTHSLYLETDNGSVTARTG
ncbi:MAG: hypothetical protein ACK5OX_08980 [Desertimonas sp.]